MMLSGARLGQPGWWRRFVAGAAAEQLAGFVVPGSEVALALGIDLAAAGLRLAANPRHADVLVLAGEIPPALATAAAQAYTQMPRPRAILAVGTGPGPLSPLPLPDVTSVAQQADVQTGVMQLSTLFREAAWTSHPLAGGEQESVPEHHAPMPPMAEHPAAAHRSAAHDIGHMDQGGMGHGQSGHDMGDMDMDHMSGGGFMSMVMMTRDLPRSVDGLPMEWLEVPFGPLFPGLPGGLGLRLTLDGDTVSRARLEPGALARGAEHAWLGPVDGFVDRFAAFDPLSPVAYRLLAERALANAGGPPPDANGAGLRRREIALLERERAASHLNWLASFAFLLGHSWLQNAATALHYRLTQTTNASGLVQVREAARDLVRQVARVPFLERRLGGIGRRADSQVTNIDGPVARAAGAVRDARRNDIGYQGLHFKPVVMPGNDARSRLRIRLAELEQSLDLLLAIGNQGTPVEKHEACERGTAEATLETPRGAATLGIEIARGQIVQAHLSSSSQRLVELIPAVAEGHELADALLGIASLDISPWEIDR